MDIGGGVYRTAGTAITKRRINMADVLFVVDESSSMGRIANDVRTAFNSTPTASFPDDTRMAVTNTHPSIVVNTTTRAFDPIEPFRDDDFIYEMPGFIKLVTRARIANFKSNFPAESASFTFAGCDAEWFRPADRDANGIPCLTGASQLALRGTGEEAGLVSVEQLTQRIRNSGGRLFRQGTIANIIFVSDTHDAGNPYYGRPFAPASRMSANDLTQLVERTNPGLAGLRFHGIVPLPPAGDARLNGVKTVGQLPATLAESRIGGNNGEDLWDFSYLDVIRRTEGAAMHPSAGNSWTTAIPQMVAELGVRANPVIDAGRAINSITRLEVDGRILTANQYTIRGDGRSIEIFSQPEWGEMISFTLEFR